MNKLTVILTLCIIATAARSQSSVEAYIKAHTKPVYSIDPHDKRMDDLEAIGNAIGDAQVVSLGEQDHGDAPSFLAKARLVRYLHEKKGFTVIAFESDFYSLVSAGNAAQVQGVSPLRLMNDNIFSIWTGCTECSDIFHYIDSSYTTSSPLAVTGFDSQLHGSYRVKNYKKDMQALLEQAGSRFTSQLLPVFDYIRRYYPLHGGRVIPVDSLVYFDKIADSVSGELQALPDSSFIRILVKSLQGYIRQHIYFAQDNYDAETVRDRQMAENFLWLYRYKYPGQKIIIWAHNYHIAKNTYDAFPTGKYGRHLSMGNELARVLKDTMYILGFTSYQGRAGRVMVKPFRVKKPAKKSIENWMADRDPAFAFVDLKGWRLANPAVKEPFFMKGKFHTNAEAVWTDVFDGVFYIRDMYPCSRKE